MDKRLAIVVLFTLCIQPVAAADSVMNLSPFMPPMEQFYTGLDGTLRCIECALSYWDCMCVLVRCGDIQGQKDSLIAVQSQSSSSSYTQALSNECSFYDPPLFPDDAGSVDLTDVLGWVNDSHQHPLVGPIQRLNEEATTVQTNTVIAHVKDTYLPGYRGQISPPTQPHSTRRHAPRKDGFACPVEGCNKAYDRNCELK